jgi:hypothetical protein
MARDMELSFVNQVDTKSQYAKAEGMGSLKEAFQ